MGFLIRKFKRSVNMFRLVVLVSSIVTFVYGGYATGGGYDGGVGYATNVQHNYVGGGDIGGYGHGGGGYGGGFDGGYGGGNAHIYDHQPIGYDGVPLDTPEVEHAKAEHFRAHEEAKNRLHTGLTYKDLPIDTHEVAIAKVAHAQAHAVVKARNQNIAVQHAYAGQHQDYQQVYHHH